MPGPLVHAPSAVVRQALFELGIGSYPPETPWPLHVGEEPGEPDNCVTLYDVRGRDHGRNMVNWERAEHHGLQVRVRCTHYEVGYRKARQIAVAFDTDIFQQTVVVEADYLYFLNTIVRTTDVVYAGFAGKEDKRIIFTVNALVVVRGEQSYYPLEEDLGTGTGTGTDALNPELNFELNEGAGVDVVG